MRAFNFSPGPAVLPLEVLEQAQAELLDWRASGMSVMEISHRSKAFEQVAAEAEADLRDLLSIPRNYTVLFLQGGASAQFSFVPMELRGGLFHRRLPEHRPLVPQGDRGGRTPYAQVHVAGDAGGNYTRVPPQSELRFSENAAYVHYTPNETIGGVEFGYVPETHAVPLVADMSSSIFVPSIDVSRDSD